MEGKRGRKRSNCSPTTKEAPLLDGSLSQSIPRLPKQRRESTSTRTSKQKSVGSLLTELSNAISGDDGSSVKKQVLEALGVRQCDASTQTEGRTSREGPSGYSEYSSHVPAVGVISSLRRKRRSRSAESPIKRPSRSSSKDHKSPEAKSSRHGRELDPDDITCALCLRPASEFQLGFMYGPYRPTSKQSLAKSFGLGGESSKRQASKKVFSFDLDELCWVHCSCAAWTPGIVIRGTSLEGLSSAIEKGRMACCVVCGRDGATVPCGAALSDGCLLTYHYPCAVQAGCFFSEETLKMFCEHHHPDQ